MKKLSVLLLVLFLLNCSSDDANDCGCVRELWESKSTIITLPNGLPKLTHERIVLSTENAGCQEEEFNVNQGNNIYYDIRCEN